jgi:hypothetical protein
MIEYKTKFCHQFSQKEIVVSIDSQSGLDPSWLISFFETSVAEGKRYKSNETVQVGWMVLILKETESNNLELWEPQFDSIPIKWTRGVNNTIRHLILQKSVAKLLNVDPVFPSLRHCGQASDSFLSNQTESKFYMKRGSPFGNYSGWEIADTSFSNQNKEYRSLFELSFHQMTIVPFLALPIGVSVTKKGNDIAIEWGEIKVSSKQSALLNELAQSEILI